MHIQDSPQGWRSAVPLLPDYSLVKSVGNPDVLREARETWAEHGRSQEKLSTIYRYYFTDYPDWNRAYTADELKAYWRGVFGRFINRTFLETQVQHLSAIETLNEHTDSRMVTDKALLLPHLRAEQIAVEVWNSEYRGRVVTAGDGSSGLIPAYVRLCIVNGPVGNDIPAEFMRLAIETDNWLGYHNYQNVIGGQPTPDEFRWHSGRWQANEQAAGQRPTWAFTEGGAYIDTAKGWRHAECLNGNLPAYVECQRLVARATSATAAAREGRLIGPTAVFTASTDAAWKWYRCETGDFMALNQMFSQEWRVSAPGSIDVDEQTKTKIKAHAQAIIDLVTAPPVLFQVRVKVGVTLNIRSGPATTFADIGDLTPADGPQNVYTVAPNGWLKIDAQAERWISGSASYTERV